MKGWLYVTNLKKKRFSVWPVCMHVCVYLVLTESILIWFSRYYFWDLGGGFKQLLLPNLKKNGGSHFNFWRCSLFYFIVLKNGNNLEWTTQINIKIILIYICLLHVTVIRLWMRMIFQRVCGCARSAVPLMRTSPRAPAAAELSHPLTTSLIRRRNLGNLIL